MGTIASPKVWKHNEKYQILARVDDGATVVVDIGSYRKEFKSKNGMSFIFGIPVGVCKISSKLGNYEKSQYVSVKGENDRIIIWLHMNIVPEFNVTGLTYKIVDDNDFELNEFIGTLGNWKIRFEQHFLGSKGTVRFTNMHGQKVDIFLVGGGGNGLASATGWGGSGGGGGYTVTIKDIELQENLDYFITIGGSCGSSSIEASDGSIKYIASGGSSAYGENNNLYGGSGGSGGGGGHARDNSNNAAGKSGNGGSNGSDGTAGANGGWGVYVSKSYGGKGQISTPGPLGETGNTYEFGETGNKLYSSGGMGGSLFGMQGTPGDGIRGANSGAGGNGSTISSSKQNGFSGIVIIRNSRSTKR